MTPADRESSFATAVHLGALLRLSGTSEVCCRYPSSLSCFRMLDAHLPGGGTSTSVNTQVQEPLISGSAIDAAVLSAETYAQQLRL